MLIENVCVEYRVDRGAHGKRTNQKPHTCVMRYVAELAGFARTDE